MAALVRGDGDALDVLGYGRVDDLVNRPVVPEVDHLGALRLEQPPDDVYGCVVPVEQARCRDEADGVARDVKGPGGAAMAPTARVIGSTIVEYKTSRYRDEAGPARSTGPLNWPAQLARSTGPFSSVEHGEGRSAPLDNGDEEMSGSVILSGARTPIGKLGGALASMAPVELGSLSIAEALRRAAVQASAVDYVLMGQVLQAGQGQNPARQAAVAAGIPMSVPAMTINKVCLSSLQALHLADLMIGAGEAEVVVVGGMESMSKAPYLLDGARAGLVYGDAALRDVIATDGLTCAFDHLAMGCATERDTAAAGIGREDQDAVAVRSHDRAVAATKSGRFAEETFPVAVPRRRGDPILVTDDEGIRPGTTQEQLAGLRPAFSDTGTITAGNASQNLRRGGGPRSRLPGRRRQARSTTSGRSSLLWPGRRSGYISSHAAVARYRTGSRQGRAQCGRPRSSRGERGVRGRCRRFCAGPFPPGRLREPERRRHRPRSPAWHVRGSAGSNPCPRVGAHRRAGRGSTVRRWRPG